jgi:predicted RNase H-like HicB family nuclease
MQFTAVVEYCKDIGLYVGYMPQFPDAHSQGETLDELNRLLEDGEPSFSSEFVGTQQIAIA